MEAAGIEPASENVPERRLRAYFVFWVFARACAHEQARILTRVPFSHPPVGSHPGRPVSLNDVLTESADGLSGSTAHGFLGRKSNCVIVGSYGFLNVFTSYSGRRSRNQSFCIPVETDRPLSCTQGTSVHHPKRMVRSCERTPVLSKAKRTMGTPWTVRKGRQRDSGRRVVCLAR